MICKEGGALYKRYAAYIFSISFVAMMLLFPEVSLAAVRDAIGLWAFSVLPSLLPFFICSNFIAETGFNLKLAELGEPVVRRAFKASGACAFPFIMSLASGYPVGVKILADLRLKGSLSKKEAEKGLSFCSTSGPLFMLGTVGVGMLMSETAGWIIAISHYAGAILNGIIFGRLMDRKSFEDKSSIEKFHIKKSAANSDLNLNEALSNAIMDAISTLFLIAGYMAVFMMLIYYIKLSDIQAQPWFSGLLELSVGCRDTAGYVYYTLMKKTVICTALISFGGACVLFQSISFLAKTDMSIIIFLLTKVNHAIISAGISYILCKFFYIIHPLNIDVFSFDKGIKGDISGINGFIYNIIFSGSAVCIMSLVFILILFIYEINNKNK